MGGCGTGVLGSCGGETGAGAGAGAGVGVGGSCLIVDGATGAAAIIVLRKDRKCKDNMFHL